MHPFSVGDVVECIDDTPLPGREGHEPWIRRGALYRISEARSCERRGFGVNLEGVVCVFPVIAWHAWRFAKLEMADQDFLEQIREVMSRQIAQQEVLTPAVPSEG